MCCRNGGYVSVAEMGVCAAEMWGMCYRNGGMYQLQKWGGEVQNWGVGFAEMGSTTIQALDMCQVKLCNETCDVM